MSQQTDKLAEIATQLKEDGFPVSAAICKSSASRMAAMEEIIVSLQDNIEAKKFIKREHLIIGMPYELQARNINVGIWDGHSFHGIRRKCGEDFIDSEFHHDLDDRCGTARATRVLS